MYLSCFLIFTSCLLLTPSLFCQTKQLNLPLGITAERVFTYDSTIYLATRDSKIYFSNDSNIVFKKYICIPKTSPDPRIVNIVHLENYVFILTRSGVLYKCLNNDTALSRVVGTSNEIGNISLNGICLYNKEIYLATSSGIYKSDDLGETWTLYGLKNLDIYGVAIEDSVIVASGPNIYRPLVRHLRIGSPWLEKYNGLNSDSRGWIYSKNGNFYLSSVTGFYTSTDKGENWNKVLGFLGNPHVFAIANNSVIVSNGINSANYQAFISYDSCKSWIQLNYSKYITSIAAIRDRYYSVINQELNTSEENNISWDIPSQNIPRLKTSINGVYDSKLIYSTPNAVYLSDSSISSDKIIFPKKPEIVYSCDTSIYILDSGYLYISNDEGNNWDKHLISNDKITFQAVIKTGNDLFISTNRLGILRYSLINHKFSYCNEGFDYSYSVSKIFQIDSILFLSSGGVPIYKSINNGINWEVLNVPTTMKSIQSLVINDRQIKLLSNYSIHTSNDLGESWDYSMTDGLPSGAITYDSNKVYIANNESIYFSDIEDCINWTKYDIVLDNADCTYSNFEINSNIKVNTTMYLGTNNHSLLSIDSVDNFKSISIQLRDLEQYIYCQGDTLTLNITSKGDVNPDNEFIVEISDSYGGFIDTLVTKQITKFDVGTIAIPIPFNATEGSNYKIRVRTTSPPTIKYFPNAIFSVNSVPKQKIIGNSNVSLNQIGVYSTEFNNGHKYKWSIDSGSANIIEMKDHICVLSFPEVGSIKLELHSTNSSGCSSKNSFNIQVESPLSVNSQTHSNLTVIYLPETQALRLSDYSKMLIRNCSEFRVYNILGNEVLKHSINLQSIDSDISLQNFSNGLYFVSFGCEDVIKSQLINVY